MSGNMQENGLRRLYMEQLKDIHSAEELRQGLEKHLEQTEGHVERLEQIFSALGENPDIFVPAQFPWPPTP